MYKMVNKISTFPSKKLNKKAAQELKILRKLKSKIFLFTTWSAVWTHAVFGGVNFDPKNLEEEYKFNNERWRRWCCRAAHAASAATSKWSSTAATTAT